MQELIFGLFGGTALLLLGIELLGEGLERAAGDAMRKILNTLTSSLWRGITLGTVLTSIIQSSSATTVMVVGFVNAGMMTLKQALGVIYGASIGTTMTSQLLRLRITDYALPIIGIGVILKMLSRSDRLRHIGTALSGFGLLFLGLTTLSSGSGFLLDNPQIAQTMQMYASNPLVAVLIGLVVTAFIQSSSASTGLVIALAQVGLLNLQMSAGIVLGCNIGTCVTAMLASSGTSKAAQRAAWGHTLFKVIGVLLVLPFFYPIIRFIEGTTVDIKGQIANLHTMFNVATTLVFIPFTDIYVKLLYRLIPGELETDEFGTRHLDKLLLHTPDAAIEATFRELVRTNQVAVRMYKDVHTAIKGTSRRLTSVGNDEELLNHLQREITRYIVELGQQELNEAQSAMIPDILHMIGDLERIGDHAFAMVEHVENKNSANISFSSEASEQLNSVVLHLDQMAEMVHTSLQNRTKEFVESSKELDVEVKKQAEAARLGHIERLENGTCTVDAGIYFLDILSHYERISEHFRNIILACAHRRSELIH